MILFNQFNFLLITPQVYSCGLFAKTPDWSAYANILKTVKQGKKNGVDLAMVVSRKLKNNGQLESVYLNISAFPIESRTNRVEHLAFYINANNILTVKMVLNQLISL